MPLPGETIQFTYPLDGKSHTLHAAFIHSTSLDIAITTPSNGDRIAKLGAGKHGAAMQVASRAYGVINALQVRIDALIADKELDADVRRFFSKRG